MLYVLCRSKKSSPFYAGAQNAHHFFPWAENKQGKIYSKCKSWTILEFFKNVTRFVKNGPNVSIYMFWDTCSTVQGIFRESSEKKNISAMKFGEL